MNNIFGFPVIETDTLDDNEFILVDHQAYIKKLRLVKTDNHMMLLDGNRIIWSIYFDEIEYNYDDEDEMMYFTMTRGGK